MSAFPSTMSAVRQLASGDRETRERVLGMVARAYWRPIYKYIRLKWRRSPDQTEDLTQGFFQAALARDMFREYEGARGHFRGFLRVCLDRYLIDEHRRATTLARGSGEHAEDISEMEFELTSSTASSPEEEFDLEWQRHLMRLALREHEQLLTEKGRTSQLELFKMFHGSEEPPSYRDAAEKLGISVYDVTNGLHAARADFKRVALGILANLAVDEDDYTGEAKVVFGIDTKGG